MRKPFANAARGKLLPRYSISCGVLYRPHEVLVRHRCINSCSSRLSSSHVLEKARGEPLNDALSGWLIVTADSSSFGNPSEGTWFVVVRVSYSMTILVARQVWDQCCLFSSAQDIPVMGWNLNLRTPDPTQEILRRKHREHFGCSKSHYMKTDIRITWCSI